MKVLHLFLSALILLSSGCTGYTQKATLPADIQTIYVETVVNKIPVESIFVYQPGLEMQITKAIIRRLNQDGNLRVVDDKKEADAVLKTDLKNFDQGGVRFNSLESVEEFRLSIVVDLKLLNARTKEVLWIEEGFEGDAEYFVTPVRSLGRDEGFKRAIDRLARNIVDRIVEDW